MLGQFLLGDGLILIAYFFLSHDLEELMMRFPDFPGSCDRLWLHGRR